jgi:hypothetical protein
MRTGEAGFIVRCRLSFDDQGSSIFSSSLQLAGRREPEPAMPK